ncbi:hypothetical protein F4803DRAFT_525560 [Xylaria telfairii]|nr:hypothetical protein F4803DRAFT_525560 [Xylaria telfairii]
MYHGNVVSLARLRPSHQALYSLYPQLTTRLNYVCRIGARAMTSSQETATMKKRAVAGSFIFKIPNGDDSQAKVALFRRSSKVRTYPHKLAPCSGSVEEYDDSPLATALREIQEETTLPASSLELLRAGKPYAFTDASIGREWSIHPFAFRLKDVTEGGKGEEGISLDWEHKVIEWFDPMQVSASDEFGGVPRLIESLRRVWPEYDLGPAAGRILTNGLVKLRDDHDHGARELANMAVSILRDVIHEMPFHPPDDNWWPKVRMAAWHICQSRPSIGAAITSATMKALGAIKISCCNSDAPEDKLKDMAQVLDSQLARRRFVTDAVSESFTKYVRQNVLREASKEPVSVLTLSQSSTIYSSLLQAASTLGVPLDLRVLESRPLCEGVALASRIIKNFPERSDTKVTIYSDASVALAARGVDIILLGADRIDSAGDVINKIGSLPTVLTARYINPEVKVLVLSDGEKIAGSNSTGQYSIEENSPSELTRAWKGTVEGAGVVEDALSRDQPTVTVKNAYFEWIPAGLIDVYLTEGGIWTAKDIQETSKMVDNEINWYFGDL